MVVMNRWRLTLRLPLRLIVVVISSTIQALPGHASLM
jgi:hypothetical protein